MVHSSVNKLQLLVWIKFEPPLKGLIFPSMWSHCSEANNSKWITTTLARQMIFSDNPVTPSSCINVSSGTSSNRLITSFTCATAFRHISTVCRRPNQWRDLKCDRTKSSYYNVINVVRWLVFAVCSGSPKKHIVETGMLPPSVQDNQKRSKVETDIFRSASRCGEVIISLPYKAGN